MSREPEKMLFPGPEVLAAKSDVSHVRSLSLGERAELLIAACRGAATIEEGRRQSGLPPSTPVPWPDSTREFMTKWASHAGTAAERH
jgi:hypothetical protein